LYYGAYKSARRDENLALLARFFGQFNSLPFDDTAAEVYGRIRAELTRRGTPIGPNDLMIAAIALVEDAACFWRRSRPHAGHTQYCRILACT
jgi:tRNA(fMet)-specific endonuclease VapC